MPATDPIITTWPSPLASRAGSRPRVVRTVPSTLVSNIHCQSASDDDSMGSRPTAPPALFTSTRHSGISATKRVDRAGVGHVELQGPAADGAGDLLQPVEPPGAEHDVEAFLGEAVGRGGADAARRAGHHRHTPVHGSTVSRPSSGPGCGQLLRRRRRPPERLGHGDGQEGAGDPPLVAVEPVEHDLERVLQRLAQEPEEGEPHEDAGGQHDAVGAGRHAPGAGQQAHQVAAHHQEHDRQAGPVEPALDPADRWPACRPPGVRASAGPGRRTRCRAGRTRWPGRAGAAKLTTV